MIDLNELRDSARQVVDGADIPAAEDKIWPLLVELGWPLVGVPEELGGLGLGLPGACVLHNELGRGLSGAPLLPAMMVVDAVAQSTLEQREAWLERLTTGEYAAAPLAEPAISADGSTLTGLAPVVQSADSAGHVLVWTEDGECVALVDLAQAGVDVRERPMWDTTRRFFDVRLEGVALDDNLILARGDAAQRLIARIGTVRDFGLAADAAGAADALLEMTVEHLRERRQFGRPLALFQALKHRCADLKALTASAEALLFDSLARFDDDRAAAEVEAETAKYMACSAFAEVAEESLQLHGGIGMAAEHPCHLFLKRARLNEHLGRAGDRYQLDIADSIMEQTA